jgi:hypothetical protein
MLIDNFDRFVNKEKDDQLSSMILSYNTHLKQERVPLGCATEVVHGRVDSAVWKTANRGFMGHC